MKLSVLFVHASKERSMEDQETLELTSSLRVSKREEVENMFSELIKELKNYFMLLQFNPG